MNCISMEMLLAPDREIQGLKRKRPTAIQCTQDVKKTAVGRNLVHVYILIMSVLNSEPLLFFPTLPAPEVPIEPRGQGSLYSLRTSRQIGVGEFDDRIAEIV